MASMKDVRNGAGDSRGQEMRIFVQAANPELKMSAWGMSGFSQQSPMSLCFDNICPLCNNGFAMGSVQNRVYAFHNLMDEKDECCDVVCVHRCPVCNGLFVTKHVIRMDDDGDIYDDGHESFPERCYIPEKHIEALKDFSPRFYFLYTSAVRVGSLGMTAVVGNIWRMALECIVTDYVKHLYPDDVDKIERASLAGRIDYLKDVSVEKDLVDAARVIGNGFTHYVCEFSKEDLDVMQDFLESFCMYVSYKLKAETQVPKARGYLKKGDTKGI